MRINRIFILPIKFYRKYISPLLIPSCRFYPSCSQYAVQAFEKYSVFKGLWLSIVRILKCNPLNPGGYDPLR